MKIQLKRASSVAWAQRSSLDQDFQNGSIVRYPKIGESMVFYFDRMGKGSWHTTPITAVKKKPGIVVLITGNSEYHIKKGWKE